MISDLMTKMGENTLCFVSLPFHWMALAFTVVSITRKTTSTAPLESGKNDGLAMFKAGGGAILKGNNENVPFSVINSY